VLALVFRLAAAEKGGTAAVLWRSGTAAPDAHRIGTAVARDPILLAANAEAMKVVIGPGESDLNGVVEVREGAL